jgi:hypothetical protein
MPNPCLLHATYYVINNYNVRQEIWVSRVWEMLRLFLWESIQMKITGIVSSSGGRAWNLDHHP